MATAGLVVIPLLGLVAQPLVDLSEMTARAVVAGLLGATAVSGTIAWRLVSEDAPLAGVLAGALTAVLVIVPSLVGGVLDFLTAGVSSALLSLASLSAVLAGIGHQQLAYPNSDGCLTFDRPDHGIVVRMPAMVFVSVTLFTAALEAPSATGILLAVSFTATAFVATWLVWGVVPELQYRGAVAGLCTILLAYILLVFVGPVYVVLAKITAIGGDTFFGLATVVFFSTSPAELTHVDVLLVSVQWHTVFTPMLLVVLPLGVVFGAASDRDWI